MSLALASRKAALLAPWLRNPLWAAARAVPSLDLRFADSKSLTDAVSGQSLITFTRASGATFTDSQAVVRNAVTNLLLRSEEFNDASWTKSATSVTQNDASAPNGALTADKIVEDTSTGQHTVGSSAVSWVGNTQYTFTIYAKAAGRDTFDLLLGTAGNWVDARRQAVFNVTTGTVEAVDASPAVASIQAIGNGWYRCRLTSTTTASPSASSAFVRFYNRTITTGGSGSYTGDGTSGIFLWGAQLEQSATVGEYIPTTTTINSAPRFDHNPTTGESLGLLIEEQRTNSIRNNTMVGAVAGTPGTLPTNWSITLPTGLSSAVSALGVDSGVAYVDIRVSGTASATGQIFIAPESTSQIVAASGQSWTASWFLTLPAGSITTPGLSAHRLDVTGRTALAATVESSTLAFTPSTGALVASRQVLTRALNVGTTERVHTSFRVDITSGTAIDFTLRIGMPQLEQGAFATSVIPTTGTAATRSASLADLISAAIANNIRSFYVEFSSPAVGTRGAVSLNDNTANERLAVITSGTDPRLVVHDGGVEQANIDGGTVTANDRTRVAVRIGTNDFAISVNGGAVVTDTSGTLPTVDRLMIGRTQAGEYLNGRLARFVGWSQLLPDSTLQTLGR